MAGEARFELKSLENLENPQEFSLEKIREALLYCQNLLKDSYNQLGKTIKVPFLVKDFTGREFTFLPSVDLEKNPQLRKEATLLVADIVNFIEEIQEALSTSKRFSLEQDQVRALKGLNSPFLLCGITKTDKLNFDQLRQIENPNNLRLIYENFIPKIFKILNWEILVEDESGEKTVGSLLPPLQTAGSPKTAPTQSESSKTEEEAGEKELSEEELEKREWFPRKETSFNQEFNLAKLDPQSKLYLQSLSIITINQALQNAFSPELLAQYGLESSPSFDQLSLSARRQLMNIAFGKVENLLATGQYDLQDLISRVSSRGNFAREAGIDLLLDLNGVELIRNEIVRIAGKQTLPEKERAELKQAELNTEKAVKAEDNKIVDEAAAENFFENNSSSQSLKEIEEKVTNTFSLVSEETFIREFSSFAKSSGRDQTGAELLIRENVIPAIKVLVQEGYPIEVFRNLQYERFIFYFGRELISLQEYQEKREEILNLIISYWKTKRIIWSAEVRREIAYERLTPEQVEAVWQEAEKNPQTANNYLQHFRRQTTLNRSYDPENDPQASGDEVIRAMAGQKIADPVLLAFQQEQQDIYLPFFQDEKDGQKHLQVLYYFYQPQENIPPELFAGYPAEFTITQQIYQEIQPQFSVYDLYGSNSNEVLNAPLFYSSGQGQSAYIPPQLGQSTAYARNVVGKGVEKGAEFLGKKALEYGMRAAIGAASGGSSEAAFAALAAAKKIPVLGQFIDQMESDLVKRALALLKKYWPFLLPSILLFFLPAWVVPVLLGGALVWKLGFPQLLSKGGLLKNAANVSSKAGLGKLASPDQIASKTMLEPSLTTQGQLAASKEAGLLSGMGQTAMQTATQAIAATLVVATTGVLVYKMNLNSAFLTDFPARQDSFLSSVEKTSKYAKIEKKARIIKGCPNAENSGTKCANPNFPLTIEYEITISPKEDYRIRISNLEDKTVFHQNLDAWQEIEGRTPTPIPDDIRDATDFPELVALMSTSTPTPADPNSPTAGFIEPGESLTLTYRLEDLDANYKHTSITNTVEVNFYYSNAITEGVDSMKTAARICLGECSGGAGCWPTTGYLAQMPFGSFSHSPPNSGGYADAYDIANQGLPPVYAPYAGDLCFAGCSDTGFGCYYILNFEDGGESRKLLFAHFEEANPSLSIPNSCMLVEEGFLINSMGSRGFSTGPHLHYEADYNGVFYSPSSRNFSILETLVPETDEGNYPPVLGNNVSTCY